MGDTEFGTFHFIDCSSVSLNYEDSPEIQRESESVLLGPLKVEEIKIEKNEDGTFQEIQRESESVLLGPLKVEEIKIEKNEDGTFQEIQRESESVLLGPLKVEEIKIEKNEDGTFQEIQRESESVLLDPLKVEKIKIEKNEDGTFQEMNGESMSELFDPLQIEKIKDEKYEDGTFEVKDEDCFVDFPIDIDEDLGFKKIYEAKLEPDPPRSGSSTGGRKTHNVSSKPPPGAVNLMRSYQICQAAIQNSPNRDQLWCQLKPSASDKKMRPNFCNRRGRPRRPPPSHRLKPQRCVPLMPKVPPCLILLPPRGSPTMSLFTAVTRPQGFKPIAPAPSATSADSKASPITIGTRDRVPSPPSLSNLLDDLSLPSLASSRLSTPVPTFESLLENDAVNSLSPGSSKDQWICTEETEHQTSSSASSVNISSQESVVHVGTSGEKNKPSGVSDLECEDFRPYKSKLLEHETTPSSEKLNVCKTSDKSFTQNSMLVNHERFHTGKKPFVCERCGRSFARNSNLVSHERIHTGEKPYVCKTCGKSFFRHYMLVEHEYTHRGVKPYVCNTCGKLYTYKNSLDAHERTHTG